MSVAPVELRAADGVLLRGEVHVGGDEWLVLVHDEGGDLDAWRPLLPLVAASGRSAVVFDLRGHGGSDDPWDVDAATADVAAAAAHARAQGSQAVVAIATGTGALLALRAAEAAGIDALGLLSPAPAPEPLPRAPGIPKLVLVGAANPAAVAAARAVQAASIGWTGVVSFPTAEQGTALLTGEWRSQALDKLAAFVDEQAWSARP